mmetsp:Transcript_27903/g.52303  ORF Transcript_27903/g.52303 Transcript_27903/m.52303 type:complete len:153 (+) Transcript_27903:158-616(+)
MGGKLVKMPIDMEEFQGKIDEALGDSVTSIPGNISKQNAEIKAAIEKNGKYDAKINQKKKTKTVTLNKTSTATEIVSVAAEMAAGEIFRATATETVWGTLEPEVQAQVDEAGVPFSGMVMKAAGKTIKKAINKSLKIAIDKALEQLSAQEEA